jgi:hypothetical protein
MDATDQRTDDFLAGIPSPPRRRDAATLIELMCRVTGEEPESLATVDLGVLESIIGTSDAKLTRGTST